MKVLTGELQTIIEAVSKEENVWRFEKESAYVPSKEAHRIGRIPFTELRGLLNRNKELRRVFGDLAWILVKVEGDKLAKDDLSNVKCSFFNRYPNFTVLHKNVETRNLKGEVPLTVKYLENGFDEAVKRKLGTLTVEDTYAYPYSVEYEEILYWSEKLREEKERRGDAEPFHITVNFEEFEKKLKKEKERGQNQGS